MTVNLLPPLLLDDRRLAYNPGNTPSQPMLPHDRPLSEVEFVAFDLETTGLFPVVDRVVDHGA